MPSNAIGMIETKGYVAALAAADAMVTAANVTITDRQQVGDGLVAVVVTGEVGAIEAALALRGLATALGVSIDVSAPQEAVYDALLAGGREDLAPLAAALGLAADRLGIPR